MKFYKLNKLKKIKESQIPLNQVLGAEIVGFINNFIIEQQKDNIELYITIYEFFSSYSSIFFLLNLNGKIILSSESLSEIFSNFFLLFSIIF